MSLIFRFLWLVITLRALPGRSVLETDSIELRVLPNDLDLLFHMNNGRYLTIMDLGRVALMIRVGFWKLARARGWYPVVGAARVEYRRPLNPLQRYRLETRVVGWDDRWFYVEQRFIVGGKTMAEGRVKAMMRSKNGLVSPAEVAAALGVDPVSPPVPDALKAL